MTFLKYVITVATKITQGFIMQTATRNIKVISIGNSKGIRLPKVLLQKYGIGESLFLEETELGLLLRKKNDNKLSYKETYQAMAQEPENWEDFDQTLLEGLDEFDSQKISYLSVNNA